MYHANWTSVDKSIVFWTDELTFTFFKNDANVFVRIRSNAVYKNSCVALIVKFGGVTVWGAMSYRDTVFLTPLYHFIRVAITKMDIQTPSITLRYLQLTFLYMSYLRHFSLWSKKNVVNMTIKRFLFKYFYKSFNLQQRVCKLSLMVKIHWYTNILGNTLFCING